MCIEGGRNAYGTSLVKLKEENRSGAAGIDGQIKTMIDLKVTGWEGMDRHFSWCNLFVTCGIVSQMRVTRWGIYQRL